MKTKPITSQRKIRIYFLLIGIGWFGILSSTFAQDNTPPSVQNPINDVTVQEDTNFRMELKLNEVFSDESPLTFSVNKNNADWLANVGNSVLVGFPLEEHIGNYRIDIKATDSSGNATSTSFTISVTFVDDAPIVVKNLPGQLQRPGFGEIKIGYKGTFYDEEDENLNYEVHSTYNAVVTAELVGDSIIVTEKGIGPAEIILTATDSNGNHTEAKMFIRVYEEAEILNMTTENTGSNSLSEIWVTCLKADYSGNIWAGFYDGVSKFKDGKWEHFKSDYENMHIVLEIWDDTKGNIVFVTKESIVTYNDEKFTFSHNVGEEDNFINIIGSCIAQDSCLYIAGWTSNKFIITRTKGDKSDTVYSEDKINGVKPFDNLYQMAVDNKGNIWLADFYNLFVIQDGICSNFSAENNITDTIAENNFLSTRFIGVDVDIYGNIWFSALCQIYKYNLKENTIRSFTSNGLKQCIFADDIGNIWVGTNTGQIVRIRDDKVDHIELKNPTLPGYSNYYNSINNIYRTNDGRYWFCSRKGLYISENFLLKDESTILQNTFDGLPSNEIYDIQRDQNGIYWVNTLFGLSAFNGIKWDYHGMLRVCSIDDNGRKLCAHGNGQPDFSIIDRDDNSIEYGSEHTGFKAISDIQCDKNNNIWLSGHGDYGLVKFDGSNWTKYGVSDGLPSNSIEKIFADSKGDIWMNYKLASSNRISKFDGSTFTHFYETDGIGRIAALDFLEDNDGNIWIATFSDGLAKFNGQTWTNYNQNNGLKSNGIASLALDYLGGIWITYSSIKHNFGVCRFDGSKFEHFTTADGLPTNNIKNVYVEHALTNQNKSATIGKSETKDLIWLGSGDKGAANFYLQNATSVVDRSLPEMEAIIFPNPTNGVTNIILDNHTRKFLDIEVLSIDGRTVFQNSTSDLNSKVRLDLLSLPSGTYLINLKSDVDTVVKKIIKR